MESERRTRALCEAVAGIQVALRGAAELLEPFLPKPSTTEPVDDPGQGVGTPESEEAESEG